MTKKEHLQNIIESLQESIARTEKFIKDIDRTPKPIMLEDKSFRHSRRYKLTQKITSYEKTLEEVETNGWEV